MFYSQISQPALPLPNYFPHHQDKGYNKIMDCLKFIAWSKKQISKGVSLGFLGMVQKLDFTTVI